MKLAIIGSRSIGDFPLEEYLPSGIEEIVSGGAKGIDRLAAAYAKKHGIALVEFFPNYVRYGKGAPLKRNEQIAEYAEEAIAFWDGYSRGTKQSIDQFKKLGKHVRIVMISSQKEKKESPS